MTHLTLLSPSSSAHANCCSEMWRAATHTTITPHHYYTAHAHGTSCTACTPLSTRHAGQLCESHITSRPDAPCICMPSRSQCALSPLGSSRCIALALALLPSCSHASMHASDLYKTRPHQGRGSMPPESLKLIGQATMILQGGGLLSLAHSLMCLGSGCLQPHQ